MSQGHTFERVRFGSVWSENEPSAIDQACRGPSGARARRAMKDTITHPSSAYPKGIIGHQSGPSHPPLGRGEWVGGLHI
jgi:hypothetical protein